MMIEIYIARSIEEGTLFFFIFFEKCREYLGCDHFSLVMIQKYVCNICGDNKSVRDIGCFCICRFRFITCVSRCLSTW